MRKLIESTHVALGGQIDSLEDWAFPYLDDDHPKPRQPNGSLLLSYWPSPSA